jgi:hypothetical protein
MAIVLQSSSSGTNGGTTTVTAALPAGTTTGDLLVGVVFSKNVAANPGTTYTINDEPGWTALPQFANNIPPYMRQRAFLKVAQAGEIAPVFDLSNAIDHIALILMRITGAYDFIASSTSSDGASPFTMAGFTIAAQDVLLLGCLNFTRAATTVTIPATYSTVINDGAFGGAGGMAYAIASKASAIANPPAADWGVANGGTATMQHIAIGNAAAGGMSGAHYDFIRRHLGWG